MTFSILSGIADYILEEASKLGVSGSCWIMAIPRNDGCPDQYIMTSLLRAGCAPALYVQVPSNDSSAISMKNRNGIGICAAKLARVLRTSRKNDYVDPSEDCFLDGENVFSGGRIFSSQGDDFFVAIAFDPTCGAKDVGTVLKISAEKAGLYEYILKT